MDWTTLDDHDLSDRTVLVRVDLNVPVKDGRVTDATRIERIKPTVDDIIEAGGYPVLMAHFGRPKGERVPEMSLGQVRDDLARILDRRVIFAEDCIGAKAKDAVGAQKAGEVVLLENTRFHAGEEENDSAFAAALAALAHVYVSDAFSAAHRAHASTEGIARLLPAAAGRAMAAELTALETALEQPERPLVAVVGGAKVSTKLDLLANLVRKVDALVIGGGMANTFLAAQGHPIGRSLAEREMTDTARDILSRADEAACEIVLPADVVVAADLAEGIETKVVSADACPDDMMILDAGPDAVERIKKAFDKAATVVWNGPLGAFETQPFDAATVAAARHAAEATEAGRLTTVAGGGDTVAALNAAGVADRFSYVSTAGGAFLEWLEGKTLPGVAALSRG